MLGRAGIRAALRELVWGRVTRQLAEAYQRLVDHDFVGQYLKHYVEGMQARAF